MLKWVARLLRGCLLRYVDRGIRRLLESHDYETALRHSQYISSRYDGDIESNYFQILALIGLQRHDEAIAVADKIQENPAADLSRDWEIAFEVARCRALYGLGDFKRLYEYSEASSECHPDIPSLEAYRLLASLELRDRDDAVENLERMEKHVDKLDEAWHFFILYSAYKHFSNHERACDIARLALAKFPDDDAVRTMQSGDTACLPSISKCLDGRKIKVDSGNHGS